MKKLFSLILACVMILSLTACSLLKPNNQDPGGSQKPGNNSGNGAYPRVTYFDGKDGYKYAASLQNAHLVYNYGEDRSDGKGVVSYPFEFLNCEDYHYHCRYTLVGYDEARKGNLSEPDEHVAIVLDNGKYVLYDFYRKLIVDDFPFTEVYEDKYFLPEGLGSAAFGVYRNTIKFEEESGSRGNTDVYYERAEISPVTSLCGSPKGFELTKRFVTHGQADHESKLTSKKFFFDSETEVGLYCEFYSEDDPKVKMDSAAGEAYYEYTSELDSVVEVTVYEIGKVSPSDVKAKVTELMTGHESEYRHVSFSEYSDIFE
ncbi:MAG: hypothetical protein J5950_08465 [Clostridia bacterium]|nr:hypothetical protein [Clostridia bacterium]